VFHFNFYKSLKSNLTNANVLCLHRFGSGRNKLVQILIWAQKIFCLHRTNTSKDCYVNTNVLTYLLTYRG